MSREPAILEEDEELEKQPQPHQAESATAPLSPLISEGAAEMEQQEQQLMAETGEEKGMQETEGEKQLEQQSQSHTPPPAKENKVRKESYRKASLYGRLCCGSGMISSRIWLILNQLFIISCNRILIRDPEKNYSGSVTLLLVF
jgi:hypothetical protein